MKFTTCIPCNAFNNQPYIFLIQIRNIVKKPESVEEIMNADKYNPKQKRLEIKFKTSLNKLNITLKLTIHIQ